MDEYKRRRRRSRAVMSMFLDSLGGSIDNVDVATFDSDGSDLKALVVGIEPIQSGTGDPSPDNVRPISGHSSVNVIVSPTFNPLDGTITNIPLGQTVYGGTLDVTTGKLTVSWKKYTFTGNENLYIQQTGRVAVKFATGSDTGATTHDAPCSDFIAMVGSEFAYIYTSMTADELKAYFANNSVDIVYKLATPQTIQLTGQQIATFLGTNNVWCDSGKIIHLEY